MTSSFPLTDNQKYTCYQMNHPGIINGDLTKSVWQLTPRSPRFGDIVDGRPGWYETYASLCWDDLHLYVAFWIHEPNVSAEMATRDSRVYLENDIEVFIAGEDTYYELQINALGTIYEVFYIPQEVYESKGYANLPQFQLKGQRIDILGGFQDELRFNDTHPQVRWAFRDWDFPGLQSATQIQGTLNDISDIDHGWTVELAFPWKGMKDLFPSRSFPPHDGDIIKMDFSRFELLFFNGQELQPHPGWTWTPHGRYDSHLPESFTIIQFSESAFPLLEDKIQ